MIEVSGIYYSVYCLFEKMNSIFLLDEGWDLLKAVLCLMIYVEWIYVEWI